MFIRPPDKPSARRLQRAYESLAKKAPIAAAAAEIVGVSTGHPYQLTSALAVLVPAGAYDLARRARQLADDPPRRDFARQTGASLRSLNIEAMLRRAGREPLLEGPEIEIILTRRRTILEDRLIDVARAAFRAAGYLNPTVRAFERAQGALEADAVEDAYARASEARGFATQTAQSLDALAVRAEGVPEAIQRDPELAASSADPRFVAQLRRPASVDEYLSDSTIALLFEAGIRIDEVREQIVRNPDADPWRAAGEAIAQAGVVASETAEQLRTWNPLATS